MAEVSPILSRLSTGNESLDRLLGGGLPAQSMTVLAGHPGTGKTILAMQTLFHQAKQGQRCVYFTTLSEPPLKMIRYMQMFDFFDAALMDDRVKFIDLGAALLRGGPAEAAQVVQKYIESQEPDFAVFDSFKAIHDLIEPSAALSRSLVYELCVSLAGWGTTTLLLGEYAEEETTRYPEFAIADGVISLVNERRGLTRLREFEIQKLRGADYVTGRHFFEIHADGLHFFPRVRSAEGDLSEEWQRSRVTTGLNGLDDMLRGGLWSGSTTVIEGGAGSGKTLLALRFLVEGARVGERAVHFGLEERPPQLRASAGSLGWDLAPAEASGMLTLHYTSPVELNPDRFLSEALRVTAATGAQRVVFDSVSSLAMGVDSDRRFRELLYALATHLRGAGITSIFTAEVPELLGAAQLTGRANSSVADNVIILKYVEVDGQLERAITVLKARGMEHSKEARHFAITAEGPAVGDTFPGMRGVLTGLPQTIDSGR